MQADSLPVEPQGKPKNTGVGGPSLLYNVMKKQIIIKITYNLLDPVPGLLLIHFPTV